MLRRKKTLRDFTAKCTEDIRKRITVPSKNEHIITAEVHRIRYSIDHKMVNLPLDDLHLAEVLLELHMIQAAEVMGDKSVMMYREWYEPVFTHRGEFTQKKIRERVLRDQVSFTEDDIIKIATAQELKKIGGVIGMFTAKVIPFTSFIAA